MFLIVLPTCVTISFQSAQNVEATVNSEPPMTSPELYAEGTTGRLEITGNKVCIRRSKASAGLYFRTMGDKEFLISSITAIAFRKPRFLVSGSIQFSFMGGTESKGGLFGTAGDDNAVLFGKKDEHMFMRMKKEIERRMNAEAKSSQAATVPSDADEIAKLADLRDRGILTEDEFQHKKKQILGL